MGAVMLGSLLFNFLVTSWSFVSPGRFLTVIFALASSSLLVTVICKEERLTFWSFLIFEACVGMYFPSIGYLKGKIIEDGVRGRVYGMLRIPLNVFVVVALSLTREGRSFPRSGVRVRC
jgi:ABC-type multidrug transport system permease subunit